MRACVACWMLVVALAATAVARPSADAIKKANAHFKLGQEFFKSKQYDRALQEYQAALDLTGEPLMLFNIALAHDKAGRAEQALETYLRYLEQAPEGAIADEARQYVARLTPVVDQIHRDRASEEARKAAAQQAERDRQEAARREEARRVERATRERDIEEVARSGRLQRVSGIAVAGLGLLGIGVGVKFGLDARSIADELAHHQGAWTDADLARDAEGRSANTRMIVFSAAGGAALLGGGMLYLLGHRTASRAERMRFDLGATATTSFAVITISY